MWIYKEEEFKGVPDGVVGYVYIITSLSDGRMYIGKKLFTKAGYKMVKNKSGVSKRKKVRLPSDWETYHGSNDELKELHSKLGGASFKREILHLCTSLSELSYLELREQIDRRVLETPLYFNAWISVKIRKSHLSKSLILL
jgi:hypothetical protein